MPLPTIFPVPDTRLIACNRMVWYIQNLLTTSVTGGAAFNSENCYTTAQAHYLPSMEPTIIQVVPGPVGKESLQGNQGGGIRGKRGRFILSIFYRLYLDQYGRDDIVLSGQNGNIIAIVNGLTALFGYTWLPPIAQQPDASAAPFLFTEPMRWESETQAQKVGGAEDNPVLRIDQTWSGPWNEFIPDQTTI